MNETRGITNRSRLTLVCVAAALWIAGAAPSAARTAIINSSTSLTPAEATAFSTPGDGAGAFVPLNNWISLLFSAPYATSKTDTISIFTLPPTIGKVKFTISFGVYNNGSPIFFSSSLVNAGGSVNSGNLFQKGCSAFGGCDYVFIETTSAKGGANGAQIDYVSVNGEPTTVTAPSPEPSVWALMIVGFVAVGARLKSLRRAKGLYSLSSAKGALAR